MKTPRRGDLLAVIVCPTSTGGHIEHALDLAIAIERSGTGRSVVLSRPGAREYAAGVGATSVDVREVIPALIPGRADSPWRKLQQMAALGREHLAIWRTAVCRRQRAVVIQEEPRYPRPGLLTWPRGRRSVLILHNVVDHDQTESKAPDPGLVGWLRDRCISNSLGVVVHGRRQAETFAGRYSRSATECSLPLGTYLTYGDVEGGGNSSEFLCLGELRANKGIEVAIEAAGRDLDLRVVGRAPEPQYAQLLRTASQDAPNVSLEVKFLDPHGFEEALRGARALVLPYVGFSAQSGVLARGIAAGAQIICSDIPALREQAGRYPAIEFVAPGDSAALRTAMIELRSRSPENGSVVSLVEENGWDDYARAVVGTGIGSAEF